MAYNGFSREKFFEENPFCCFCGGETPAKTIDHVPAKVIFSLKLRPRGLEFPACHACNQGAKKHEQVAAVMSRLYPDTDNAQEYKEMGKLFRAVERNQPGFLLELQPDDRQINSVISHLGKHGVAGTLNASGPIVNRSLELFSAKMGFALHYLTTGKIIPPNGGATARWITNFQKDEINPELFGILDSPKGLEMGKWQTIDQFSYSCRATEDGAIGAYFCTFRQSFATLSWVCTNSDSVPIDADIFKPGFLLPTA